MTETQPGTAGSRHKTVWLVRILSVGGARIAGGGLLSLGIACWWARHTPSSPASRGVAWAFLTYNVVACCTLAWAGPALASGGLPALGAAVLHGVLGAALLAALLARGEA